MKTFSQTITVKPEDLDILNHVNNITYVKWVQDIAMKHWDFALTNTLKEHFFCILLNHNIDYKKPAILNDIIEIKTFIQESAGVKAIRCVEFYLKKNNTLLAQSKTTWCLFSKLTQKPHRLNDALINCFN